MFEYIKTPIGSYWLSIVIAGVIWLLGGGGILAGINHYFAKIRDADSKADSAERQKEKAQSESLAKDARLAVAESKILELTPKPLPERLILFGLQVDARFREMIEAGERTFKMRLNAYQYGQLEAFAKEDLRVAVSHSTNTNVGPSGPVIEATLRISAGFFHGK